MHSKSGLIKCSLALGGDGETYVNDASLMISGQFVKHLRRGTSRRM